MTKKLMYIVVFISLVNVGISVASVYAWQSTHSDIKTKERNDRLAKHVAARAALTAKRQSCISSIPQLKKVNAFIIATDAFGATAVNNAYRAFITTPKDQNKQRHARKVNWIRLALALRAAHDFTLPIPTEKQCKNAK